MEVSDERPLELFIRRNDEFIREAEVKAIEAKLRFDYEERTVRANSESFRKAKERLKQEASANETIRTRTEKARFSFEELKSKKKILIEAKIRSRKTFLDLQSIQGNLHAFRKKKETAEMLLEAKQLKENLVCERLDFEESIDKASIKKRCTENYPEDTKNDPDNEFPIDSVPLVRFKDGEANVWNEEHSRFDTGAQNLYQGDSQNREEKGVVMYAPENQNSSVHTPSTIGPYLHSLETWKNEAGEGLSLLYVATGGLEFLVRVFRTEEKKISFTLIPHSLGADRFIRGAEREIIAALSREGMEATCNR